MEWNELWVDTQLFPIGLQKSEKYILCRFVDIRATSVLRKVPLQRNL